MLSIDIRNKLLASLNNKKNQPTAERNIKKGTKELAYIMKHFCRKMSNNNLFNVAVTSLFLFHTIHKNSALLICTTHSCFYCYSDSVRSFPISLQVKLANTSSNSTFLSQQVFNSCAISSFVNYQQCWYLCIIYVSKVFKVF